MWKDKVFPQFLFLFSSSNEDYFIVKLSYAFSLLDENRKRNLNETLCFHYITFISFILFKIFQSHKNSSRKKNRKQFYLFSLFRNQAKILSFYLIYCSFTSFFSERRLTFLDASELLTLVYLKLIKTSMCYKQSIQLN